MGRERARGLGLEGAVPTNSTKRSMASAVPKRCNRIMGAEREATLADVDDLTRREGGRRGEAAVRTPTDGLVSALTRHATSRAGDPCPHDHVHAPTMVGRLATHVRHRRTRRPKPRGFIGLGDHEEVG
ncbi:MAG: relaxase domain-containing protein [Acidimicrobiales bacterium]